jgi:exodeoxyribonuclease VII small subunit
MSDPNSPTFEAALAALEQSVQALEDGRLTLDESLAVYEQAVHWAAHCQKVLEQAEQRVLEITAGADGQPRRKPLDLEVPPEG